MLQLLHHSKQTSKRRSVVREFAAKFLRSDETRRIPSRIQMLADLRQHSDVDVIG
jgi:hypothetical protein